MKDSIALLLTASAVALFSWAFWHFLGQNAFEAFSTVVMFILGVDNFRLRRKLRELGGREWEN